MIYIIHLKVALSFKLRLVFIEKNDINPMSICFETQKEVYNGDFRVYKQKLINWERPF